MRFVVTGGAGFFGSYLIAYLTTRGHEVLSLDLLPDRSGSCPAVQVDISNKPLLEKAVAGFGNVDGIFHVAAILAHDRAQFPKLWSSNLEGTRNVMEVAEKLKISRVVFTSSNCVFATGYAQPVDESVPPSPIEEYGLSKLAAEELIASFAGRVGAVIIRCPTIISAGRLGLLSILFDFVREGRRLYLLGDGSNRYSFVYAGDLAEACLLAITSDRTGIYHIGSDNVPSLRQLYQDLIAFAGKTPRLVSVPERAAIGSLHLLNALSLSPLGPYHYRMLAANFVFANAKIKTELGWSPTRTNSEMLCEAYRYYIDHRQEILSQENQSPHRRPASAGILNLLRLIS